MYVGRRYTARVTGSAWKTVTCEHCRLDWAYEMMRTAEGTGTSPYFLDDEGASERAGKEARETLAARLNRDVDVAWCPECYHLQQYMFGAARMKELGSGYWFAGLTAIVALGFCCLWGNRPWLENCWSPPGVFIFAAAALIFVFTLIRSRRFDPNADAEIQKRKNRLDRNKVMLRSEYEAARQAARDQGIETSKLLRLTWPGSDRKPRRSQNRSKRVRAR